jgi:mono/diheme cytochrome c family protein
VLAAGFMVLAQGAALAQAPAPDDTSAAAGAALFNGDAGCGGCHGAQGQGDFGPRLAGATIVQEPATIIRQVIFGGGAMPALGDQLSDAQIAAVVNYVRTQLNTYTDTVTADDVTKIRNQ